MSKAEADKLNEVVARLNKVARKHLEIEARMKRLEESLGDRENGKRGK